MNIYKYLIITLLLLSFGCEQNRKDDLMWLSNDSDSVYIQIERHFRGFDLAMKEVGDRYSNIYSAANDENWKLAIYNLTKLKTAIDNGLERRPNRKLSAQAFLNYSIPSLMNSIKMEDKEKFLGEFEVFRQSCNNCHIREKAEYIKINIPQSHLTIIGK